MKEPSAFRKSSMITSSYLDPSLAFQADITRVVPWQARPPRYPFPRISSVPEGGTSVSFHGGSHHQDDPAQISNTEAEPVSPLYHAYLAKS
jgi:hypothetical protein